MPKATLTYTLPEEQAEYDAAREGSAARSLIWAIDQHCRSLLKHGSPDAATRALAGDIRQMILEEPGVTLD
jgi:hypothetical protein